MVEVAGSSERFRDDVRNCTVSTRYSRIQIHILVSVEVVVAVFGRWITVHSNMHFWKSRLRALGRMIQSRPYEDGRIDLTLLLAAVIRISPWQL